MKRNPILILLALVALTLVITNATNTHAQTGEPYELTWSTIDGGGATFSTGGVYELGGTMGQPDAGVMSGEAYSLGGGFWAFATNVVSSTQKLFLPLILKSP